ncbi:N-6 DNA methylase [Haladaptatus sp. DFWS20]|uniref:N-6 DNA methylase n=1 Tax=Haladaptatus sp. DFWS20 TaxID=3403467 RepID=UPI003EB738AF
MSISDLRREIREIRGVTRVAELAEGLLLINGTKTGLVVYGGSKQTKTHSETRLEVIAEEFDTADYLLASIEGVAIVLEGTLNDFEISYLPTYTGDIGRENLIAAVDELIRSSVKRETLPIDYFSETERDDVLELFEQVLTANLTAYYTPQPVAHIAANWATAGERTSVIDTACGSGELLTAAIDAIGEPSYSLGIDQNSLACALAETRIRERKVSNFQISGNDFFVMFDEIAPNTQRSLGEYVASDGEPTSIPRDGFILSR